MYSQLSDEIVKGTYESVKALIGKGVEINTHDQYGSTPLIIATTGRKLKIVKLLISKGALIDEQDFRGCTALFWAVDFEDLTLAKILLDAGADPNRHSAASQPILAYPLLRNNKKLGKLLVDYGGKVSFARDYINAKLIGHRFELEHKIHIVSTKPEFIRLSFEGFFLEFTLGILQESLEAFIKSTDASKFKNLFPYLKKVLFALDSASTLRKYRDQNNLDPKDFAKIIDKLLDNDPIIIPVAYEGHAITFVRYHNTLAQCDRGAQSKVKGSVCIYDVTRPEALNKDLFKKLIYERNSGSFLNMQMLLDLGLDFIEEIPTESQVAGNCSWANVEASVATLLCMLMLEGVTGRRNRIRVREEALTFHQAWIQWDKDRALNTGIANFHKSNKARKASKASILGAVLFQRCQHNNRQDVARAKKIIAILRKMEFRFIISAYVRIHCRAGKMTLQGKRFSRLLKKCGENFRDY